MSAEDDVRAKLEASLGPVQHSDLAAHLRRDAVLVVAPGASLVDCALAVAKDDVPTVRDALARGVLARPDETAQRAWAAEPGRRWLALVVQPFVLVQDLEG